MVTCSLNNMKKSYFGHAQVSWLWIFALDAFAMFFHCLHVTFYCSSSENRLQFHDPCLCRRFFCETTFIHPYFNVFNPSCNMRRRRSALLLARCLHSLSRLATHSDTKRLSQNGECRNASKPPKRTAKPDLFDQRVRNGGNERYKDFERARI